MTMASSAVRRKVEAPKLSAWPLDPYIVLCAAALLLIGLVMVASASTEVSARTYGSSFYMLIKHGAYLGIALAAGIAALSMPIDLWQRLDRLLLLTSFVLLVAVLVPGIGREVNGSTRWIPLGFFSIQGSEFVKLFSVVFIAGYLVRHGELMHGRFVEFLKPIGVVMLLAALLLQQPDFGAAVVIVAAVMGVIFLAGAPMRFFAPIIALCVSSAAALAVWQPYRLERLAAFTNPWEHQFSGGYQLTQALIAFGRGEWFGLGLGNSIQKLFFLPEAHTDFLFSIVAEELGIVGAVVIIATFATLILRAIWVGRKAETRGATFAAYLAYGIAMLIGIQAAINIGVNIGLLPTKGLTLPLMSYGGNSLIVSCILIGVLLRIEYEFVRQPFTPPKRGGRRGR